MFLSHEYMTSFTLDHFYWKLQVDRKYVMRLSKKSKEKLDPINKYALRIPALTI